MRRLLQFFSLVALLCTFFSCKKDSFPTIVKGIIVDSKTGAPLEGATVEFYNRVPSQNGNYNETIPEYAISNSEGEFTYTVRSDAKYASIYSAFSEEHVRKRLDYEPFKIVMGTTNEFTIPLVHYDAYLKLNIKNESGQNNLYVVVENPTIISEARTSWGQILIYPYPLNLNLGENKSYILPIVSNEYTKIYWGETIFISNQTVPTYQDSIFLTFGDTLDYSILY